MRSCFSCRYGSVRHACAPEGTFDPSLVARTYFRWSADREGHDVLAWAFDCMTDAVENDADAAWSIILECLGQLETGEQAALLGAGIIEDFTRTWGEAWFETIRDTARHNDRLRYALTGVWPPHAPASPFWTWMAHLRSASPAIDRGDPLPPR